MPKMCSRICHWGPMLALGIIKWVSLATVYSNTMWWPPESSYQGLCNMIGFIALSSLTTFHFFCAMCDGPGYLPNGWEPENKEDLKYLQYCESCRGYKAPRAHHCRKCGRCVMKMDHHCPWINNCVGHYNHGHFLGFLFFAVIGCAQATYILTMTIYYGLNRNYYRYYGTGREPKISLTVWSLLIIMFGLGLAIGVVLAVGTLMYFQLRAVWRNQTGIEDWIIEKADYRRKGSGKKFRNPYALGFWRNVKKVLTFSCYPNGDGITWEVAEDCHQFTLTIEQKEQKAEKRLRTREYHIIKPYAGSWCPIWSFGFKVGCRPPCTDEPRIPLANGDRIRVTRWKKHWLYGDKVFKHPGSHGDQPPPRMRGWFPRKCAVEVVDDSSSDSEQSTDYKRESKKLK